MNQASASSPNNMLRLRLLGRPEILMDGHPLTTDLVSAKGQALLIYLVVTGRSHSRSALAGLLWGDLPEESARANLRLTLSRLRKHVSQYLDTGRQAIAFNPGQPHWLDVHEFEGLLAAGAHSAAAALYQGDFLQDFLLPNAPDFDNWLLPERERLRQEAVSALLAVAVQAGVTGDLTEGIAAAQRLLALEPWSEEGHRRLMWLLAAAGRRGAALTQFETCRRLLADELGVEPAAETLALYDQIRSGEVQAGMPRHGMTRHSMPRHSMTAAASLPHPVTLSPPHLVTPSPPHNLRPPATPFIGREAEQQRLQERLLDPAYRLVTLAGEGGTGKTRLALAVAEALRPHFPGGTWFVSLAGLPAGSSPTTPPGDDPDPAQENQVAAAIAAALGINFSSAQEPRRQLLSLLSRRHCLLILDNFEEFIATRSLVLELLNEAPQVTLLVTSRQPLHLQAEYLFRLDGLAVPPAGDPQASTFDSVRLFAERAERATGRPFALEHVLPVVVEICRFTNGLPLAIELAATALRRHDPAGILDSLRRGAAALATTQPDVPARHRSLQTVFMNSWRLLDPAGQRALAQLAVFRGPFRLTAAETITGAPAAVLWELVDKSLVQQPAPGYLALHDLLCQFAAAQCPSLDLDLTALHGRHAAYYMTFVAAHTAHGGSRSLNGRQPRAALQALQAEKDNLERAWRWATAAARPSLLAQGLEGMAAYWNYVGLYGQGEQALDEAVRTLQGKKAPDPALLAALLGERGYFLYELTRYEELFHTGREALELATQAGRPDLQATAYLRLGQGHWGQGDYRAAHEALTQALALLAGSDQLLLAVVLRNLAAAVWRQGDVAQARALCTQALDLHRQMGDLRGEARTQYMLAIIAQNQSHYDEARQICEECLRTAGETGDVRVELAAHSLLGLIAGLQWRMDEALAHFERDLQLCREMGAHWSQAVALSNLGDLRLRLGDYAAARACYDQALQIQQRYATSPMLESNVRAYLGLLAHHQGDHPAGEAECLRALELARDAGVPREEGFALLFLAHNLAGRGALDEADATYQEAVQTWERLGDTSRMMEALAGLVRLALARGEVAAARPVATRLLDYLAQHPQLDGADDPLRVYLTCYRYLQAAGEEGAPTVLQQARTLLQSRAAKITNPTLRQSFLRNVPSHWEVVRG